MAFELEDKVCPHCGKQLVYRKEIRDHLTLKLCQGPQAIDDDPYNKVDRPYREPDERVRKPPRRAE